MQAEPVKESTEKGGKSAPKKTESTAPHDFQPQPVKDFTKSWGESAPEVTERCKSDVELVKLSKDTDTSQWPPHVQICEHCRLVLELLRRSGEPNNKLNDFIQFARSQDLSSKQSASIWTYLGALVTVNRPLWIRAVAALVFMVGAVLLFDRLGGFYKPTYQPETVALSQDIGFDEIRTGEAQLAELRNSPPTNIADLNGEISDYNQLAKRYLDTRNQLQTQQRARMRDLLTQSYSELYVKREELTADKSPQMPNKTPGHDQYASLYATVDRATSKKNGGGDDKPQTELETAYSVKAASQQQIVILPESTEVELTIWDRLPDRRSEQKKAVIDNLTVWSNEKRIVVNFKSSSGTARITPGAANTFSAARQ